MAIFLPTCNAILLEVPRTSSKWARAAIAAAGIEHAQIGPPGWRGHGDLSIHGREFAHVAAFVRNPLDWYASYWSRRRTLGWREHKFALDRACRADTFAAFVRLVVTWRPGFLDAMFARYTGTENNPISFIGHQETAPSDLMAWLNRSGVEYSPQAIVGVGRVNASSNRPDLTRADEDLVAIAEYRARRRYGYSWDDPIRLDELVAARPEAETTFIKLALWTERTHWAADERNARLGRPRTDSTRHTRILCNYAIYAEHVLGDVDLAESLYSDAHERDPEHPRTLACLGSFLTRRRGSRGRSARLLARAVALRPEHPDFLTSYASLLSESLGRHDAAESLYRRALRARPAHARALGALAAFLEVVRRDYEGSEELYLKRLECAPEDVDALCDAALFYARRGRPGQHALSLLRKAAGLDASNPRPQRLIEELGLA